MEFFTFLGALLGYGLSAIMILFMVIESTDSGDIEKRLTKVKRYAIALAALFVFGTMSLFFYLHTKDTEQLLKQNQTLIEQVEELKKVDKT